MKYLITCWRCWSQKLSKFQTIESAKKALTVTAVTGSILMVIHNPEQLFIEVLFLPAVGLMLLSCSTFYYFFIVRGRLNCGPWQCWLPLTIILVHITVTAYMYAGLKEASTIAALCGILFVLYTMVRDNTRTHEKLFMWTTIISAAGMVIWGIMNPGIKSGGYAVSPTNYDIIVGVLVVGTLLSPSKHRWWLAAVAGVGLFFTGADEGLFVSAVLVAATILAMDWRDWGWRKLVPVIAVTATAVVCIVPGITTSLYAPAINKIEMAMAALTGDELSASESRQLILEATGYRVNGNWELDKVGFFGQEAYTLFEFYDDIPHNIALIATKQAGIPAALAWLWVSGWLLKKNWRTGNRYLFMALLALGVFDHFVWNQMGAWWWIAVGASSK